MTTPRRAAGRFPRAGIRLFSPAPAFNFRQRFSDKEGMKAEVLPVLLPVLVFFYSSCTFVYSPPEAEEYDFPNITMEDLTYIRMKDGELSAKLEAETGDRYESKHLMKLKNYKFVQYNDNGEADSDGHGGSAVIEISSNNIQMTDSVEINVESEDYVLKSEDLDWKDAPKTLESNGNSKVNIRRGNGTEVNGTGFFAEIRSRNWSFKSDVEGVYVNEEDEAAPE